MIVDYHRSFFDFVHSQNSALRGVQNGGAQQRSVNAAVADGKRSAFQVRDFKAIFINFFDEINDGLLQFGKTQPIGMPNDRNYQAALGPDRHPDMVIVVFDNIFAVYEGVDSRNFLESLDAGLDKK